MDSTSRPKVSEEIGFKRYEPTRPHINPQSAPSQRRRMHTLYKLTRNFLQDRSPARS